MRSLGRRVVIGLGVLVVAVMAVGYGFIFSGIASPPGGDLAVLDVPPPGEVRAVRLDDGRPAYALNVDDAIRVIDARGRHAPDELGSLVAWCDGARAFIDLLGGTTYGPDGSAYGTEALGLSVFDTRAGAVEDEVIVESGARDAGAAPGEAAPLDCRDGSWVVHEPEDGEIFDPSVAADEEPPGWVWLDGTLEVADGAVRLCDGTEPGCETFADVTGIDPATLAAGNDPITGRFIGRVRDDAIEGLLLVPRTGEPS